MSIVVDGVSNDAGAAPHGGCARHPGMHRHTPTFDRRFNMCECVQVKIQMIQKIQM
jgi:hypothetical protein